MTFGQFIKQKRIAAGLIQREVADHLGYSSYTMISMLENDKRPWTLEHIERIAELFDMLTSKLIKEWEDITTVMDDSEDVLDRVHNM